eukprot:TRINITY_DN16250_c0_g1_i1.p2 TRINITY_DN16250_c0_g1~~TRINITY_DN16250_c0_g1_i1.p2  ORF type:complete len:139 (+),score=32.62 TRINITY_DN16250_c0_g1_i1:392-808(+)
MKFVLVFMFGVSALAEDALWSGAAPPAGVMSDGSAVSGGSSGANSLSSASDVGDVSAPSNRAATPGFRGGAPPQTRVTNLTRSEELKLEDGDKEDEASGIPAWGLGLGAAGLGATAAAGAYAMGAFSSAGAAAAAGAE